MLRAVVESARVTCPVCGRSDRKIYRREVTHPGVVTMLCRCQRCDQIYSYDVDKTGTPVCKA